MTTNKTPPPHEDRTPIEWDPDIGGDPACLTSAQHRPLVTAVDDAVVDLTGHALIEDDVIPERVYTLLDAIEALPTPGTRYCGLIAVLDLLLRHVAALRTETAQ